MLGGVEDAGAGIEHAHYRVSPDVCKVDKHSPEPCSTAGRRPEMVKFTEVMKKRIDRNRAGRRPPQQSPDPPVNVILDAGARQQD